MLLFVPIRTDSAVTRQPRVNHLLIALNVAIFAVPYVLGHVQGADYTNRLRDLFILRPNEPGLYQFFTYQFLHADLWHLLGNMLFLWVFGNSVNSKMGQLTYLLFYLACGVFAGVGFALGEKDPCLGASGAIAGVTTAYLVLYPRTEVTCFYWFWFYVGTTRIRAILLIVLKIIIWDNIVAMSLTTGADVEAVAYSAHLAGYVFGFVVCFLLLLLRGLPRDQYDLVALFRRYRQRQQFRAIMADPNARARAQFGRVASPVNIPRARMVEAVVVDDDISRLRGEISDALGGRDYATAAERYAKLVELDPGQCLPRANMLLLANYLMTSGRYPQAAAAYEKFLKQYPTDTDTGQVKLVLGIIYAKYLRQYETAQRYLQEAASRLNDPEQTRQAGWWLNEVATAIGQGPSPA